MRYLILQDKPGAWPGLPGTRYLMSTPKAATFVIGAKRIAESAARTATITIIAYCGWCMAEEILRDQPSMARLPGAVGIDLAKIARWEDWLKRRAISHALRR